METPTMAPATETQAPTPENSPAVETKQAGQTPLPTGGDKAAGDTGGEYAALLAKAETDPDYQYSNDELDKVTKFRKDGVKPSALKPAESVEQTPAPIANEYSPILEKIGAKDAKEASEIVNRIVQDKENLTRATRNQDLLFQDLRAGKPEAVAYFEKNFGGKFVPNGQAAQAPVKAGEVSTEVDVSLPPEMFLSDEAHKQANSVISSLRAEIKEIKSTASEWKNERENYARTTAMKQAESEAVDSFVSIGERIGGFDTARLRTEVNDWLNGKANPKMEVFGKILDLTKKHGADLEGAFLIYQGQQSAIKIAEAEKKGREEAYGFKPSPPLSGAQGKGNTVYQPITEADIEGYNDGSKVMPDEWFDKGGQPVKDRIPEKMHKHFGFKK